MEHKNIYTLRWVSTIVGVLLSGSILPVSTYAATLSDAQKFYQKKKYDEALTVYNDILIKKPEDAMVHYNIGCAKYKKGDYEGSIEELNKALLSDDPTIEANARYNIANAKYRMGSSKKQTDLSGAVALYREALDYYKKAIEADNKNVDARFNHEYVEKELKELLDKLQKQQQQQKEQQKDQQKSEQDQKNDQQQEQKTGQEQQQAQSQEGDKKEAQEQKDEQKNEQKDAQQAKEEKDGADEKKQENDAQGEVEKSGEMTKEDAQKLLERFAQKEQGGMLQDSQQGRGRDRVLKDW